MLRCLVIKAHFKNNLQTILFEKILTREKATKTEAVKLSAVGTKAGLIRVENSSSGRNPAPVSTPKAISFTRRSF